MPASRRAPFNDAFFYGTYPGGVPPFNPLGIIIGRLVVSPHFTNSVPGFNKITHWLTTPSPTPVAGPSNIVLGSAAILDWANAYRIKLTSPVGTEFCIVDYQLCTYDPTDVYIRLLLAVEPFVP